jgi:hypothetical protein
MASDCIQEELDNFEIEDHIRDSCRSILVHYLLGPTRNPYALRRTKIYVHSNSYLMSLAQKNSNTPDERGSEDLNEKVMHGYIQYFDRKNTFLTLLVNKLLEAMEQEPDCRTIIGTLKYVEEDYPLFRSENIIFDSQEREASITWKISPQASNILAPSTSVINFFEEIYSSQELKSDWDCQFTLFKAELFGKICDEFDEKEKLWNELSSIQAALIYFKGTLQQQSIISNHSISWTIVVQRPENNRSENDSELIVMIFAYLSQDFNLDSRMSKNIFSKIRQLFRNITKLGSNRNLNNNSEIFRYLSLKLDRLDDEEQSRIRTELLNKISEKIYRYRGLPTRLAVWSILLTEFLIGHKHEGKPLDFFMVCGELSEFNDSKSTQFRLIKKNENIDILDLPDFTIGSQKVRKRAENAAKQLAKAHYPWFENARHALFWNIASETDSSIKGVSIGLISTKFTGWLQIVQNRFKEKLPFEIPNCLVCYVYGEPQRIGVLMINDGKVEELLKWQENQWILWTVNEERLLKLTNLLKELLNIDDNNQVAKEALDKTIKIALQIADHPQKGGILVFVEENDEGIIKQFRNMGKPWHLTDGLTADDAIALVSQDGATLRLLEETDWDAWQSRKILISSSQAIDLLQDIEEKQKNGEICCPENSDNEWPLNHKGSRRWSAAMTACNPKVNTVLVISQDGDIQVWHIANNTPTNENEYRFDDITRIKVVEYPLQGGERVLLDHDVLASS